MKAGTVCWRFCVVLLFALGAFRATDDASARACPCEDSRFCEKIKDTTKKEIFVFSLRPKSNAWKFYNWNKVTTVVMVEYLDINVVCHAHKYGARAMTIGRVTTNILTNVTAKTVWIQEQLQKVKDYYLDGVNFDYEEAILQDQSELRDGYTDLVAKTTAAFKSYDPSLMVSVDVAWSPACIDLRCYDYKALALSSDFLFVMAYAEQSQILGTCKAGPNGDYVKTTSGLQQFINMGIPADKLVLGVPWFGNSYRCLALTQDNECLIEPVPYRGVNCSDAIGKGVNYYDVIRLLKNSTSGRLWDDTALSPYCNYKNDSSGSVHQLWYDDPQSLTLKYYKAVDLDLRGVGVWNVECVDYLSTEPEEIKAVEEMWSVLPNYEKNVY